MVLRFFASSELFLHISNYTVFEWDREGRRIFSIGVVSRTFAEIKRARELDIRLTFHPGQHNQLGSPKSLVVAKTELDLDWHCRVFGYDGLR